MLTKVINNTYNNTNITHTKYINRSVSGAIVAMPSTAFAQSQPVPRDAHRLAQEKIANVPVVIVPPVAPTKKSVRGAANRSDKPPTHVFDRAVVARTVPPAAHAGFAAQQQQLATQPGKPLDEATRRELKRAASEPIVKVVAAPQDTPRATIRPPAPREARSEGGRGKLDEHRSLLSG